MAERSDVILLGKGIHGLIAANLLAREGVSVTLCEEQPIEGMLDSITPGAYVGPCAHFPVILSENTARALEIKGETLIRPAVMDRIGDLAGLLYELSGRIPAYDEKGWKDLWALFETGNALSGRSGDDQALFADLMRLNAADFAEKYATDASEQGVLCAMAVMGYDHGPARQGSAAGLIGAALCPGECMVVCGGLSALIAHLQDKAADYGVRVESQRKVASLVIDQGRVKGVMMEDESRLDTDMVLADINPIRLFEGLVGQANLPDPFTRRLRAMQGRMRIARVVMTLDDFPRFVTLPEDTQAEQARQGFIICPDIDYCRTADQESRSDGGATRPVMSVVMPTLSDPSLAPTGQHVISVLAQYYDPSLPADEDNQQAILDSVVQALEQVSPGLTDKVLGAQIWMGAALDQSIGPFNRSEQLSGQPIIQVLASLSGHHALGYDQPLQGLMMVGYGAEAGGAAHLSASGTRAAQAILKLLRKAA